jgi:SAM-dependent methyltransferase
MAAGCGTFLLWGLNHGYDVVGVEPESWKRGYYRQKIEASGYPPAYARRMIAGVGECLPFADESFDLVSTFQTLEHVADVACCIHEMLRVLRPGGVLYLRAPDYNCFFEPHYRLPFLPRMNRKLASGYLRLLHRPVEGLHTLNWVTQREVFRILRRSPYRLKIEQNRCFFIERKRQEIQQRLPAALRPLGAASILNRVYQTRRRVAAWAKVGRQERVIDLWITKLDAAAESERPRP